MASKLTRNALVRTAAGVTAATAMAACAPFESGPASSKKTGTVRMFLVTNDIQNGPKYFNGTVIAKFQERFPNITIDATMAPFAEIFAKNGVEIAAGTTPDLFHNDYVQMSAFGVNGAVKNLADLVKRDTRALTDVTHILDQFKEPDGKMFGLPATLTSTALLYNSVLFDRYNVKYPDDTMDWNPRDGGTFMQRAKQLTRPAEDVWGYWWTGQSTADPLGWLKQNNGTWLDKTRTKADMLKPESLDAFNWMYDMVHKYTVSPKPQDAPLVDATRGGRHWLLLRGKAAMAHLQLGQESDWVKDTIGQSAGLVKVQTAVLAKGMRRAAGCNSIPWQMSSILKDSDLAWEFLKWWYNDIDSQAGVWTTWNYGLPPARKAWADPRVLKPRDHPVSDIKPFIDPYDKGYAAFHEVNPVWSDWYAAFGASFTPSMRGEKPMTAAIQEAQTAMQNLLDQKLPKK
jgi:ABC-type glycerol-3-phosphate transport system substrate-binding protein